MCSPERLNVLLSRARNGLVMIGNIQTFTKARRGGELWSRLAEHLKANGNIYNGLPVVCDRHPAHQFILKTPADFENLCPNGGCDLPWYGFSIFIGPVQLTCQLQWGLSTLQRASVFFEMSPTHGSFSGALPTYDRCLLRQGTLTTVEMSSTTSTSLRFVQSVRTRTSRATRNPQRGSRSRRTA